jgi:hypothetical protein
MGAWGINPLENDAALDIVATWKGQLAQARAMSLDNWTAGRILDWFLERGIGETIDWGDVDTTNRLIAIADLLLEENITIDGRAKDLIEEAINWEMRKEAVDEWDSPQERRKVLELLLSRIGGKRRRVSKSKLFKHPALEFKSQRELISKCEFWVTTFKDCRYDPAIDQEYPRFWHVLDRLMVNRLGEVGSDVHFEAVAQRLILLAAYVGLKLDLSVHDIMELAQKGKDKCAVFGYQTNRWKDYRSNEETQV